MNKQELKQEIVEFFLEKNILLSSDIQEEVTKLTREDAKKIYLKLKNKLDENGFIILDDNLISQLDNIKDSKNDENIIVLEKEQQISSAKPIIKESGNVKVLFSYNEKPVKRDITHFLTYFRHRFKTFEKMLQNRSELQGRISISRAKGKREKESVSIIGIVNDKKITKNKHLMITVEDLTGTINIFINKNRADDLFDIGKNIVFDEVIGIEGTAGKDIIFANKIIQPDVPITKELKKSPIEEYAVFLGDPHFGSKKFLKKEFERLIKWLNGKIGDEKQKNISSKVKYLFIVGDIVEGVGIYPNQEEDLEIPNIYEQYKLFNEYLKKIPKHIQIIISPGNHDAMRMSEPQPSLSGEFSKDIIDMTNVLMVSNPSIVNIGATNNFSGFDVLIYHGYSFPYYADNVETIRVKGGLERADMIMELLLKKRHLAPSHTSNLYIPDTKRDPLIIEKIPDFFITGHIHRTSAKNFRNITLLNCSCWIGQTAYQEKVGLKPQPARLPIVNLKNRDVKILKFGKDIYTLDD